MNVPPLICPCLTTFAGFPWGELDLEAVVNVVDHGAGARHRLHHRNWSSAEAALFLESRRPQSRPTTQAATARKVITASTVNTGPNEPLDVVAGCACMMVLEIVGATRNERQGH
uniref:Uncharacterized protein n=1 Tax=Oryza meridionalis TaxID=40149 RepID=A0A0E0CQE9_9ORYZ